LETITMELARDVVSRAPIALSGMKRSLNILSEYVPPPAGELEEIGALINKALASRDVVEALAAFREKRDPQFKGE
jgi:enoyl-CoA hydratase/carnithine racemase